MVTDQEVEALRKAVEENAVASILDRLLAERERDHYVQNAIGLIDDLEDLGDAWRVRFRFDGKVLDEIPATTVLQAAKEFVQRHWAGLFIAGKPAPLLVDP